jgi:hypothetical protein
MTKTRRGRWHSRAKRGGAARTTGASTRGDGRVDRVPRRYGPKGRRSGGARVGGDGGEDLGAVAGTACRARYGPTGRRNGARVGAATETASGRRRGLHVAALQPVGVTQRRRRSRGSHRENHGGADTAARRGEAVAADARSVDRRSYSEAFFTGS